MSIGIDIGSKTIKIVELAWQAGAPSLKSAAVIGVKDASVEKMQDEVEFANLAGKIKKLLSDAKITSKEVYIALPESLVDRKSTRLNSSHTVISHAVFCLKKKYTHQRREF